MYARTLRKWCLKKYIYYLCALLICVFIFAPLSVTGMAVLNSNTERHDRTVLTQINQPYQKLSNVPNYSYYSQLSSHSFSSNTRRRLRSRDRGRDRDRGRLRSRDNVGSYRKVNEIDRENSELMSSESLQTPESYHPDEGRSTRQNYPEKPAYDVYRDPENNRIMYDTRPRWNLIPPPLSLHLPLIQRQWASNREELLIPLQQHSTTATAVDQPFESQYDVASRSRRDSQKRRPIARNAGNPRKKRRPYCHSQDTATRAFLAPTVFLGKVESMTPTNRRTNFSATFRVLHTYKNQEGFTLNQNIRLRFMKKVGSSKVRCDYTKDLYSNGLVHANLKQKSVYILFVEQKGLRNYTVLGEPVLKTQKSVQAVQAGVDKDYGKPANVSGLQDTTKKVGQNTKLICFVKGQPPPRVQWFKDGKVIHGKRGKEPRLKIKHLRRRSVLTIHHVSMSDAGRYECRARGAKGPPASVHANLTVIPIQEHTTTTPWPLAGSPCPHEFYCLNGGTCLFFATVGEPACKCADGFAGQRCENKDISGNTGSMYPFGSYNCKLGQSTTFYC